MKKIGLFLVALATILTGCSSPSATENSSEASADPANKDVTIYLVRHGKTWFNTTNQVQGYCDSPLTDVGIEQAEQVGVGLADVKFSAAFSSDLSRQRNTAKLILAQNEQDTPTINELEGFREKNFGSFEGQSNDAMNIAIAESLGLEYPEDSDELWDFIKTELTEEEIVNKTAEVDPLQTAETYDEVIARAEKVMGEMIEEAQAAGGGNVLVVSSGGIIPLILETIAPGEYNGEKIGNCSVTTINYSDGKYTIDTIADSSFIE